MRPFDAVILNEDMPEFGLKAGIEGAIVDTYAQTTAVVIVEFFDEAGDTIDVVPVSVAHLTVTLADFIDGERVALLDSLPTHHLLRGQVGVIKKRVASGVYEVEFANTSGEAYALVKLHAAQMLLLHWQLADVAHRA